MSLGQLRLLKQIIAAGDGSASLPIEELRRNFDNFLSRFPGLDGLEVEASTLGGVPVEWLTLPESLTSRTLVYLHGGGFVVGSPQSHRQTAARLARAARARCVLVDYRLAPESPYPAALDDVLAVWPPLLEAVGSEGVTLAGDSAGAGLAFLAMVRLRRLGVTLPRAFVAFSPWADYAGTTPSLDAHAELDPVVQRPGLEKMSKLYLGDADPWDPEVTPLRADLTGLPPLLIQAGGAETLLDDARRLADRAADFGVDVTLDVWPDMIHVWHLFAARLEEGQLALDQAGQFLDRQLSRSA
ncbi:MAG: alpha/beta hydrolase [Acidobacteriota bacterium]